MPRHPSSRLDLLTQLILTPLLLAVLYFYDATLHEVEFDTAGTLAHLAFATVLIAGTLGACALLGLPLRLLPRLARWWRARPWLPLLGMAAAALVLGLAQLPAFTETAQLPVAETMRVKQVPNPSLFEAGWLLSAFSGLHFYPFAWLRRQRTT